MTAGRADRICLDRPVVSAPDRAALSHRTDAPAKMNPNAVVIFIPANPGTRLVNVRIPKAHPIRTSDAMATVVRDSA